MTGWAARRRRFEPAGEHRTSRLGPPPHSHPRPHQTRATRPRTAGAPGENSVATALPVGRQPAAGGAGPLRRRFGSERRLDPDDSAGPAPGRGSPPLARFARRNAETRNRRDTAASGLGRRRRPGSDDGDGGAACPDRVRPAAAERPGGRGRAVAAPSPPWTGSQLLTFQAVLVRVAGARLVGTRWEARRWGRAAGAAPPGHGSGDSAGGAAGSRREGPEQLTNIQTNTLPDKLATAHQIAKSVIASKSGTTSSELIKSPNQS